MTFIWPGLLFLLLLIPVMIWLFRMMLTERRRAYETLGPLRSIDSRGGSRHRPALLMLAGLSVLLFSLSRPQIGISLPRLEGTVILAFDVSNSMVADDFFPTRLDAAKNAARGFIESQPPTVKIGIVAFGGAGLVLQNPTNNKAALLATIANLSPQGGTSLGEGIFTSLNAIAGRSLTLPEFSPETDLSQLRIEDYSSAVIVLLTDGENTDGRDPLTIAQFAAEANVRVFPIGIGSEDGAEIKVEGFNISTSLDQATLEQIANVTNGVYFHAENERALAEIYENIDTQLTIRGEDLEITPLLAGMGALLILLSAGYSLLWFGRIP